MPVRDVVVVGASAGGVGALRAFVAGLPPGLPASVLVVLHLPRDAPSALPGILRRAGTLPADHGRDGERLQPARIYVAPVDRHLLIVDGAIILSRGPTENGHRPAIDPLFRSAARSAGPRTIGVVLSGTGDDGTAGLAEIVSRGGTAFVQHPDDAVYDAMPRSAMRFASPEHVLPAAQIGRAIAELAGTTAPVSEAAPSPLLIAETEMAEMKPITTDELPGLPSGLVCPSCHGALFELDGEPAPRLRCRVGHAWSPETLLNEQSAAMEGALWMALRSLEEKSALAQRMADGARLRSNPLSAEKYELAAAEAATASRLIRDLIVRVSAIVAAPEPVVGEPGRPARA